jgi:hypothetical protein
MARKRINRYLTISADAAGKLATIVCAWQTAHPGIDGPGVVERLIAAEFDEIDQDIIAAGRWASGGHTLEPGAETQTGRS